MHQVGGLEVWMGPLRSMPEAPRPTPLLPALALRKHPSVLTIGAAAVAHAGH